MSDVERNVSREFFQEDISSKDFNLWVQPQLLQSQVTHHGKVAFSPSLPRTQQHSGYMKIINFGKTRDCSHHLNVISSWTLLIYVILTEDYHYLGHDLHGDCCAGIHEPMLAEHRNLGVKDLGERRQHDIRFRGVLISVPTLVRPED